MNSKQAKRTKQLCRTLWAKLPELQVIYSHDFRRFYRQAKNDVKTGETAMLSRLLQQVADNDAALKEQA